MMIRKSNRAFEVPNPTLILFLLAAFLAWNFSVPDKSPIIETAAVIILSLGAAGTVYFLFRRPLLAVIALVASTAMGRFYVQVFGLKGHPEHFAILFFCLALPFWPAGEKQKLHWTFPDLMVALYCTSNVVSSLVMSIAPAKTFRWAMQQTLVVLPYFLLRIYCGDRERFRRCFNILLTVGAALAGIGVFCFFSNLLFGTEFGVQLGQYGNIPGTFGTAYEANILGAISAAAFLMFLAMYLKKRRRILLWGTAITYAGMVIALARAAIGAAVITVGLLGLINIKYKLADWAVLKAVGRTLLVTSLVLLPAVASHYIERFRTLEVSDVSADYDTVNRIIVLVSATDGILQHPILGNGTASFQLLTSNEELGFGELEQGAWIGNVVMRILHDTGTVGFTIFLCMVGSLGLRAVKILKRARRPEVLALLLGCIVYAITFQASDGTLLAFFWVQLGLLGCAVSIYWDSQPDLNASTAADQRLGTALS